MGFFIRKCRLMRRKLKRHWIAIVWFALCSGLFYIDYMRYKMEPQYYYLRRMLGVGMCISRGTAAVLNLSCCVLVVPMCRALAITLSSALKTVLYRFCSGHSNSSLPVLPAFINSQASQTAKTLHVMIALTVIIASGAHTCAHISNVVNFSRYFDAQYPDVNIFTRRGESPLVFFIATVPGITGIGLMMILMVLGITSTKWARRKNYNAFFYTHFLGLLFFILLLAHPNCGMLKEQQNLQRHIPGCQLYGSSASEEEGFPEPKPMEFIEVKVNDSSAFGGHGTYHSHKLEMNNDENGLDEVTDRPVDVTVYIRRSKCNEPPVFQSISSRTWVWISFALLLWMVENAVRWWRQRNKAQIVSVVHHPCDVVQLTFYQSGFSCSPGQYVLIQCPTVSRFEWHPFTVIRSPAEHKTDMFTILMRARGDWSNRVASLLKPSSESNHSFRCNPLSLDSPPIFSSVVKPSSLKNSTCSVIDFGHPTVLYTNQDQYICNFTKNSLFYDPSKFVRHNDSHAINSKNASYSPEFIEERKFSVFRNSLFNLTSSHMQLKTINTNFSEVKVNSSSLPVKCLTQTSYADIIQNYKSRLYKSHSFKIKSSSCSYEHVQKCFDKHCYKNSVNNLSKSEGHTHSLCSNAEYQRNAQSDLKCNTHDKSKHPRKEKEDVAVSMNSSCYTSLRVDGPYTSPSEDMLYYPVIIGAAGGVGITPLAATLSHKIWHPQMWPRRIHIVWVVRDARLILVLAPLLSSLLIHCWQANMEDSIELCLHVTVPTTQQALQGLFGKDYPSLLPRITQGRPHWKHLFQEWRKVYSRQKVGVFTCGPRKMCGQVKRHCLQAVSRGSQFNYHQECFS